MDNNILPPPADLVTELKENLLKRARGFTYKETKTYVTVSADGTVQKHREEYEKYSPPDPDAIMKALRIYDTEAVKYDTQAQSNELKLKETDRKIFEKIR